MKKFLFLLAVIPFFAISQNQVYDYVDDEGSALVKEYLLALTKSQEQVKALIMPSYLEKNTNPDLKIIGWMTDKTFFITETPQANTYVFYQRHPNRWFGYNIDTGKENGKWYIKPSKYPKFDAKTYRVQESDTDLTKDDHSFIGYLKEKKIPFQNEAENVIAMQMATQKKSISKPTEVVKTSRPKTKNSSLVNKKNSNYAQTKTEKKTSTNKRGTDYNIFGKSSKPKNQPTNNENKYSMENLFSAEERRRVNQAWDSYNKSRTVSNVCPVCGGTGKTYTSKPVTTKESKIVDETDYSYTVETTTKTEDWHRQHKCSRCNGTGKSN
jgi:hypothetical protein